ncbi:uncharacterized protein Eint_070100 [Encephalitozoon intestinalis ATCC 50506]|uniref:Uncharacterized protein n=1 Tax=Encephalitozoon intestinalis (strain ATCC 50506) TaxID=876142 RepID=E0S7U0_ENCIT|nr:uncharacterized protein Eint_070100 [Encephalitozoon intestinalis ATCC 50506]ADM11775.1 hypothetical protein Eint_070100 [Encephalitozoon intestinalis ATCC 50506]UTX45523.1 hypothetical protein GPK93_07g10850 [Encephalitozoon intestinalis]
MNTLGFFLSENKEVDVSSQEDRSKRSKPSSTWGLGLYKNSKREERYHCEGLIEPGRVKFLRDFYEKNVFCNKSERVKKKFYSLIPSVRERVKILENAIAREEI